MTRRPRGLSAEERELWVRVVASARPMRPQHPKADEHDARQKQRTPSAPAADFRVGGVARPLTRAHERPPLREDGHAAQPLRMDKRTHQEMQRGKLKPEARIDLHGMTLAEAHPELIRFILKAHGSGKRLVLVITGKGKRGEDLGPIPQRVGVLRHQVPHWLAQPPLGSAILQVMPAHVKHGGSGAFYVYLRRSG